MKKLLSLIPVSSAMLALVAVVMPSGAFAASAWSTMTVNQHQEVTSVVPVHMNQSAETNSWVIVGDAKAQAQAAGQQHEYAKVGQQNQRLETGAGLSWSCATSGCANASGDTMAKVDQNQTGVSHVPMEFQEQARTFEGIWFGGKQVTNNQGLAQQSNVGAVWDPGQSQSISGSTHADGSISFFPVTATSSWSNLGSTIQQMINISLQNVFTI